MKATKCVNILCHIKYTEIQKWFECAYSSFIFCQQAIGDTNNLIFLHKLRPNFSFIKKILQLDIRVFMQSGGQNEPDHSSQISAKCVKFNKKT